MATVIKKKDDQQDPTASPLAQALLSSGVQPDQVNMAGESSVAPADNNPLVSFLKSGILPTAGAIAGGAVGGALGGGVGAVPGAGVGGAGAEVIRRGLLRLMGEDPDSTTNGAGDNQGFTGGGVVNDIKGVAIEGTLDSLFQGIGGLAGKALVKGGKIAADVAKVNPENFAARAMNLTPTEFTKASVKQGAKLDPEKTIYNVLLGDKSDATGKGIFDHAPEDWGNFAQNRKGEVMTKITAAANDYTKRGVTYGLDDINKAIKADVMPSLSFQGKGAGTLKDGSKQVLDVIDKNFATYKKAYGDKLTPNDMLDLRRSLDADLKVFKEDGAIDIGEVQKRTANFLRDKIATDMPEIDAHNKLYSAYSDVENTFVKRLKPENTLGYSFGSSVQSLPAGAAFAALSPQAGAAAYLGSFVGSQALKDPKISGKIASVLYNIKNMGSEAPPIAKTFYNALQPAAIQLLRAGDRGAKDNSKSELAANMLPSGDQVGMNDIPAGQFKTQDDIQNKDGTPNPQGMGLTKSDILMAILADPKHASLYNTMYTIMKDQGSDGQTAQQKSAMSKVDAAYAVLNKAQDAYGKLSQTGVLAGNAALVGNMVTGNAASPEVAAYETLRQGTLPILARVIGGDVGNLNEFEQQRAKFLPEVTDSMETAKKKFAMLQYLLDTRKKAAMSDPTGGLGTPAATTSSSSSPSDILSTGQ